MSTANAVVRVKHLAGDKLRIRVRGHELYTDQPWEDGGEDAAPTPTELFIASLAACVTFYAERFLRRNELSTDGLEVACDWTWASSPTRVGGISITVEAPGLTPARQEAFRRVIDHCTIHNTLLQPPKVELRVAATGAAGVH
jgi:putative redox protein